LRRIWLLTLFLVWGLTASAKTPLYMEGESYSFDEESQTLTYVNPRVVIEDKTILAQKAYYEKGSKRLRLEGNVLVESPKVLITARRMEVLVGMDNLIFEEAYLYDKQRISYLRATRIEQLKQDVFLITDGGITLCRPEEPAWELQFNQVVYQLDEYATGEQVILEFKGIPIFYSPYLAWPTKKGRASGLLPPAMEFQTGHIDKSKNWGTRVLVPYYWALDVDQDLTLTFDALQLRGLALGTEYRYAFTEGMYGQFNGWYLQEMVRARDPLLENFGSLGGPPTEFNGFPTRYKYNFDHRMNAGEGQFFAHREELSDNEVNREYFNANEGLLTQQASSASYVLPWSGGGLNLGWGMGAQFLYPSVYDRQTDLETHLNRQPELTATQRFAEVLGTGLSLQTDGRVTEFVRNQGWNGQWRQGGVTLAYPFNLDFLNLAPSITKEAANADVAYHYAPGEAKDPTFTDLDNNRGFELDRRSLEANFEVYRLFTDFQARPYARLGLRPKLVYTEVADVDQRDFVYTHPFSHSLTGSDADFNQSGYSNDYRAYGPMFDNPIYGQKVVSTRLETRLLTKDLATGGILPLVSLDFDQPYNLNRKDTAKEQNQSFVGPQVPEDLQETSLGNQMMPLRTSLGLNTGTGFGANLMARYGHEERKVLEHQWSFSASNFQGDQAALAYRDNQKAYQDLDGRAVHGVMQRYEFSHRLNFGSHFYLDGIAVWDLTRESNGQRSAPGFADRLPRSLLDWTTGLNWKFDCYLYRLEYREYIGYTENALGEKTKEAVIPRVTFSMQIASWPSTSNPYQIFYPQ